MLVLHHNKYLGAVPLLDQLGSVLLERADDIYIIS